ncbi:MAG: hypothetical protein QOJ20_3692, partial [Mycobacterium sp.]|nr:hypothetical protein [Mycobacterium sp.]
MAARKPSPVEGDKRQGDPRLQRPLCGETMPSPNGLALFLRTRRDLVKPAAVGLPDGERRRVAGLRREEV